MARIFQRPRGTQDILKDSSYYEWIISVFTKICSRFGFQKIETPIFENKEIFVRAVGKETDIVAKQLFSVSRLSKEAEGDEEDKIQYALRPEFTAGVIRAYLENGMQSWEQPVLLASAGPVFRAERPQKGRYRQLNQLNLEIIGDGSSYSDALIILICWQIFSALKIKNEVVLELNTIGSQTCRLKIRQYLIQYFENYKKELCENCQARLKTNVLRVLDCKETKCQTIIEGAPQLVDLVAEDDKKHFQEILEYLDEMNVTYDLNPRLVRGLDYYTRTVFEFCLKNDPRRQASLAGGGRYDELVKLLGGRQVPAIGVAIGVERLVDLLIEKGVRPPETKKAKIAVIQIGEKAKKASFNLLNTLTKSGYSVSVSPGKNSLKDQLRVADKRQAKLALIIGQKEAFDNTVIIRDLEDRSQDIIKMERLEKVLKKKLGK